MTITEGNPHPSMRTLILAEAFVRGLMLKDKAEAFVRGPMPEDKWPTDKAEAFVRGLMPEDKWPKIVGLCPDVRDNWVVSFETQDDTKRALDLVKDLRSFETQDDTKRALDLVKDLKFNIKLAEEQVRKFKQDMADPKSHTKQEELDAAVAKLEELKAKGDDPMNALEDPVTRTVWGGVGGGGGSGGGGGIGAAGAVEGGDGGRLAGEKTVMAASIRVRGKLFDGETAIEYTLGDQGDKFVGRQLSCVHTHTYIHARYTFIALVHV